MNEFIAKLKSLPKEKREVILKEIAANGQQYNIFPLSTEQSQMWILYQLDKNSPYYSVPMYISASQEIDTTFVQKAINAVCDNNLILKSEVLNIDGQAFIFVNKENYPTVSKVVLADKAAVLDSMESEYKKPFDLETEMPIRVVHYETMNNENFIFFNVHHMFVDGFSGNILFEQFVDEYKRVAGYTEGENSKPAAFQYMHYAMEQKSWTYERETEFWGEYLKQANFYTHLPYSYPLSVINDKTGSNVKVSFSKKQLQAVCKENKVSVYSYLLAVYYVLLSKTCGQNNITVGTPTLNRNAKTENMIGYFANTIPLNMTVSEGTPFIDFVKCINANNLDCIDNAKLPFAKIVEINSAHREDLANPIFQTVFTLQNKAIKAEHESSDSDISFAMNDLNDRMQLQFDLLCTVIEGNEEFDCNFTYLKSRFSTEFMNKFCSVYSEICNVVLAKTDVLIADLLDAWDFVEEHKVDEYADIVEEIVSGSEDIIAADVGYVEDHFVIFYSATKEVSKDYFSDIINRKYLNDIIVCRTERVEYGCVLKRFQNKKFASKIDQAIRCKEQLVAKNAISKGHIVLELDQNSKLTYDEKDIFEYVEISKNSDVAHDEAVPLSYLCGIEDNLPPYNTLIDVLLDLTPEEELKKIISINENEEVTEMTYAQLREKAKSVAVGLRQAGVNNGDKVIIHIRDIHDCICGIWGSILAGAIIIPYAVPSQCEYIDDSKEVQRLMFIYDTVGQANIIVGSKEKRYLKRLIPEEKLLNIKELIDTDNLAYEKPEKDGDEDALMLFTSGSTGVPKGGILRHRNILGNPLKRNNPFFANGPQGAITLNWMPLDHVGGIVMFHTFDMIIHADQIQVDVNVVLKNPLNWLRLIDKYRVTNTWAPNFAYGLINECAGSLDDLDVDLSCVETILNGGEAINCNACTHFLDLLEKKKLPRTCMKPSWGMTETCSGVLFSTTFGKNLFKNSVAVGDPVPGVEAKIVDNDGNIVKVGTIGFLHVTGPTIFKGYYENSEATGATFAEDGWLNTGDLAMMQDGEVLITGRAKEMIIVNGVNLTCVEIEKDIEEIEGVNTGTVGCAPQKNETTNLDEIIVFYGEHTDNIREDIADAICERLRKNFSIYPKMLVPVDYDAIPRSSIGKIDKRDLLVKLKAGELKPIRSNKDDGIKDWFVKTDYVESQLVTVESKFATRTIVINDRKEDDISVSVTSYFNEIRNTIAMLSDDKKYILNIVIESSYCGKSLIKGFSTVIPKEHDNIIVKVIEVDDITAADDIAFAESKDAENGMYQYSEIKYTDGIRRSLTLSSIQMAEDNEKQEPFVNDGVYVLIGGLGGIGRIICEYLISGFDATVVIVGRSSLEENQAKMRLFKQTNLNGKVEYYQADVMNNTDLLTTLNQINEKHKINGILTFVGEDGLRERKSNIEGNLITNCTHDSFVKNLAPRIICMNAIECFLKDKKDISVITFTSATALLGGKGYATYAATSRYLYDYELTNDANSYYTYAWSKWENTGMSELDTPNDNIMTQKYGYFLITGRTGFVSLAGMVCRNINRGIIGLNIRNQFIREFCQTSHDNDDLRISLACCEAQNYQYYKDIYGADVDFKTSNKYDSHNEVLPGNEIEKDMIQIWKKVLNAEIFSVTESFFALGGNSLKCIQLVEEINAFFGCELNIATLFKYSTIRDLSNYIIETQSDEAVTVETDSTENIVEI